MSTIKEIKKEITDAINKVLGKKKIQASNLIYPPLSIRGDISWPCFNEQRIGLTADEAFSALASFKNKPWKVVKENKFINFIIDKTWLAKKTQKEIEGKGRQYGYNRHDPKTRVMVEFTNANTHKEYHIGHLRNLCFGDSVCRILKANGQKVLPVSYINDFGIHVAKTLWALEEFYQEVELPEDKGRFLGEVYVRSTKEMDKSKTARGLVEVMMKKIESRQGKEYKLWKKTREWSIAQFDKIYQEMDIKLDHIFYESEFIQAGLEKVQELLKEGIYTKSQGAVIADLEEYGLGVLVVLRSGGTAMYPVADIPLAIFKLDKYKVDTSIYVVDNRQKLYLQQLFKILELMGFKQKMLHLQYDFVKLPSGMMSSRTGNVVSYEELRDEIFKKAKSETAKRHTRWSVGKISEVAHKLCRGAIKFEMIKVGPNQVITFNINKSLRFEGFTAAYIQYTYARLNSILTKAGNLTSKADMGLLKEQREEALVLKLALYPEIVEYAGKSYNPSEIAKYIYDLAQLANDYYHQIPVLKAGEKVKIARLNLVKNINQVIYNGLYLLGIEVIPEM